MKRTGNYGHSQSEETKNRLRVSAVKQFKLRPYESAFNTFLLNAKRRSIETNITFENFLELTKVTECTYCNAPIEWPDYNVRKHQGHNLDRKDNSRGYLFNNVVVCCWFCNNLKGSRLTYEQMLQVGALIRSWRKP
jgi:5-methylcytosine-specific restriction endonuclease McrA